jgi:target of rapamycin complex 2 subunit MAPKAP1
MRARRDQANQVTVKYACEPQKHENDEELFKRKEVCEPPDIPPGQSFEERLLSFPPIEKNKFYMYSKFDGTSNTESKTIHVFIMPFPKEQRVYPITFTVQSKAKIVEFIGFILHGCYVQFPEISKKVDFQEVNDYSLYISDESGEVDSDFPPLDNNEQIQKFHFSHLALGKKSTQSFQTRTFSVVSDSMATSARILLEKDETTTTVASNFSHSVEAASSATDAFVDTLVYQAFRVNLISKRHFKSEVQLGISGERIEIDPLQQKPSSYFFRSFKAIHYSFESVAWCEITSRKSNRFEFKIAHIPVSVGDPMFTSFDDSMMTSSLKVHSFETDPTTAEIICRKINRILDSKKTPVLREFFNRSDRTKRSFLRKRKFFL